MLAQFTVATPTTTRWHCYQWRKVCCVRVYPLLSTCGFAPPPPRPPPRVAFVLSWLVRLCFVLVGVDVAASGGDSSAVDGHPASAAASGDSSGKQATVGDSSGSMGGAGGRSSRPLTQEEQDTAAKAAAGTAVWSDVRVSLREWLSATTVHQLYMNEHGLRPGKRATRGRCLCTIVSDPALWLVMSACVPCFVNCDECLCTLHCGL